MNNVEKNKINRDFVVYLLVFLSIPGYIWCTLTHICMCGHMAHPPYPLIEIASELIWISFMVAAAVFSLKSTIKEKRFFVGILSFLIISRLFLHSLGGLLYVVEIPLLLWIGIKSIIAIFGLSFRISRLLILGIVLLSIIIIIFGLMFLFL